MSALSQTLRFDRGAANVVPVCSDPQRGGSRDVVIVRAMSGGKKSLFLAIRDGEETCDVMLDRAAATRVASLLIEPPALIREDGGAQ